MVQIYQGNLLNIVGFIVFNSLKLKNNKTSFSGNKTSQEMAYWVK